MIRGQCGIRGTYWHTACVSHTIVITTDAGWISMVARRAHNPKVAGSNPAPATEKPQDTTPGVFRLLGTGGIPTPEASIASGGPISATEPVSKRLTAGDGRFGLSTGLCVGGKDLILRHERLGNMPELIGQAETIEDGLVLLAVMRPPIRRDAVTPP